MVMAAVAVKAAAVPLCGEKSGDGASVADDDGVDVRNGDGDVAAMVVSPACVASTLPPPFAIHALSIGKSRSSIEVSWVSGEVMLMLGDCSLPPIPAKSAEEGESAVVDSVDEPRFNSSPRSASVLV